MDLFVFARFHARLGTENAVSQALLKVLEPPRAEDVSTFTRFRRGRDAQMFYIHLRWLDEAAFEDHARLPHTTFCIATLRSCFSPG